MGIYRDCSGPEDDRSFYAHAGHARGAPGFPNATAASPPCASAISHANLVQIVEGEIIPRLFLAHRDGAPHRLVAPCEAGDLADPVLLAELFLAGSTADIAARLQALLETGMPRDRIYFDLLAPVPRTLSQLWMEGRCSFDQMAIGLCRVDDVLRMLHEREQAAMRMSFPEDSLPATA